MGSEFAKKSQDRHHLAVPSKNQDVVHLMNNRGSSFQFIHTGLNEIDNESDQGTRDDEARDRGEHPEYQHGYRCPVVFRKSTWIKDVFKGPPKRIDKSSIKGIIDTLRTNRFRCH
jgi:hypothetical protein